MSIEHHDGLKIAEMPEALGIEVAGTQGATVYRMAEFAPLWQTELFARAMSRKQANGRLATAGGIESVPQIGPALCDLKKSAQASDITGRNLSPDPIGAEAGDRSRGGSIARIATFARRLMALERSRVLSSRAYQQGGYGCKRNRAAD